MQPSLRHPPVAPHGAQGNPQHFRDFFQAQSAKETQLDGASLARVEFFQRGQRIIQFHQIGIVPRADVGGFRERNLYGLPAALRSLLFAHELH